VHIKGIPAGQGKGGAVLNNKPTKVLQLPVIIRVTWYGVSQAGHAESTSEAGCWLKTVRSEESLCSSEDLPYEKDTQEDENHREGNGKQPWKIRDTRDCEYAAAPFCGVDMPPRSLEYHLYM